MTVDIPSRPVAARRFLQIHQADNVLVALQDLPAGTAVEHAGQQVVLPQLVRAKHKFPLAALGVGDAVRMYGVRVGRATQPIAAGEPITPANLAHEAEPYSVARRQPWHWQAPSVAGWQDVSFKGYEREDGSAGTRNYWLVIPLVFCENRNIRLLQDAFERALGYGKTDRYRQQVESLAADYRAGRLTEPTPGTAPAAERATPAAPARGGLFPNVDGVKFLTHEMGCGGTSDDAQTLCDLLAGYIAHPNVGGVTVLGLGCEKTQFSMLQAAIAARAPGFNRPLLYFNQQTYGTEAALLDAAVEQTFRGLAKLNEQTRRPVPLSKLSVGLKCGGSDGFSGISANPAVGYLSDLLVALGGTTLLAEFPELCGVEQEMIDRCTTEADAARFVHLMDEYAGQAAAVGAGFDMNPSPGNIRDGLITDAIKSAGAAKKGGDAPVTGVLAYTEPPTEPGLHLLCTPGNDVLATSGMAGSGATIILFTTGLGTPTGNPITPTVKISTNTTLAQRMPDIIDFDAGPIIAGQETIAEAGDRLLRWLVGLASGEYLTKAELLGQDDFIPWRRGVNL
jgi:altronate hydrolase